MNFLSAVNIGFALFIGLWYINYPDQWWLPFISGGNLTIGLLGKTD